MPPAQSISRRIFSWSSAPSAVRVPMTTPLAPRSRNILISSHISSISGSVYRKSPKRGRISTLIFTSQSRWTCLNRLAEGVVPPIARLAHSSSRSAPPLAAAIQEA